MSYFSSALSQILAEQNLTQVEVAKRAGFRQGQLSGYLTEAYRPSVSILKRICGAVGGKDSSRLLAAYLQDEIPEEMREHVEVVVKTGEAPQSPAEHDAPPEYARLGKRERLVIDELTKKFAKSPEMAKAIESVLDLLKP